MADAFGLSDVSTPDTGKGSELKTGGRRTHNMPTEKICAKRHKVGSQEYKDCIAYKNTKNSKSNPKVKVTKGY